MVFLAITRRLLAGNRMVFYRRAGAGGGARRAQVESGCLANTAAQHRKDPDFVELKADGTVTIYQRNEGETAMRIFAVVTILFLSSSLTPSFAQDAKNASTPNEPQTVPVQPERTPQQSDQAREQDRKNSEGVKVGRDWRAQQRADDNRNMGPNDAGRRDERDIDRDHHTVGRDWRARPDEDRAERDGYGGRGSYNDDRPFRRVKVCFEYENGDEYCRYR